MRKLVLFLLLAILSWNAFATKVNLNNSHHGYSIQSDTGNYLELSFDVNNLVTNDLVTEKGTYSTLSFASGYSTRNVGEPALPTFNNLIELPFGARSVAEVISYDVQEYSLSDLGINNELAPAQPSYPKNIDPADIRFVINEESYKTDAFTENELVSIRKNGTMRGTDLATLVVSPFTYNPVQKTLKVYSNIKVRVAYNGDINNSAEMKKDAYSPFFEGAYAGVINYKPLLTAKEDLTNCPITYLIMANEGLEGNAKLEEFISWKKEKGFNVVTNYVSGSASVADNDTWVESQYNNLNPKPSFLLIVGDMDGEFAVKTETENTSGTQASDLHYGVMGAVADDNHIPSLYVGRFSVRNTDELTAQVDKTIWYEKSMFTDPSADFSYLENCMGTAGADSDHQAIYGNPHIKYQMEHYFNNSEYIYPAYNTAPTITGTPFYDGGPGQAANIIGKINDGVAFYNYTAHGGPDQFCDPQIMLGDVDNLTNDKKYGLVIGNCCLTATFNNPECFGESWLNAPDKGAIGFIGASESTYWDEDLAMGVGEPAVGEETPAYSPDKPGMIDGVMNMTYPTQAAMKHAGLLAVDAMNSSRIMYYWNAYHLFGDPSLMPYMGLPQEMTVSHADNVSQGLTSFEVAAPKGAYVALSDDNGALRGAAIAGDNGIANVEMTEGFTTGSAHLAVTAQFMKPHFAEIPVEPLVGPYLTVTNYTAENVIYGETATLDIELKNVGLDISEGISLSAATTSTYATILDGNEAYENIAADGTQLIEDAISFSVAENTPDQKKIGITLTFTDNSTKKTYTKNLEVAANAPVVEYALSIDGMIKPGENKDFIYTIINSGHAPVNNVNMMLTEGEGNITIAVPTQTITAVTAGASEQVTFTAAIAADLPYSTASTLKLALTADKNVSGEFTSPILINNPILVSEEFESFPPEGWANELWEQKGGGVNDKCASTSYNHEGVAILETPSFAIDGNVSLEFYWKDKDIWKKDGNKVADHDTTFCEISNDGGSSWTQLTVLAAASAEYVFHQEMIDISSFSGADIKVRWRDVNDASYSSYGTGLDAVMIKHDIPFIDEQAPELVTVNGNSVECDKDMNLTLILSDYSSIATPFTGTYAINGSECSVEMSLVESKGKFNFKGTIPAQQDTCSTTISFQIKDTSPAENTAIIEAAIDWHEAVTGLAAPQELTAAPHKTKITLDWTMPGGIQATSYFFDDFNEGLAEGWDIIEGPGTSGTSTGTPYWFVADPPHDHDGMAARVDFGYDVDTWLISPEISVETGALVSFDWNSSYDYSVGYDYSDLFVKISEDNGLTWQSIWTYGEIGEWENWAWITSSLPLDDYVGQNIKVAFNLVANNASVNSIDNVAIGTADKQYVKNIKTKKASVVNEKRDTNELTGFKIFRNDSLIQTINNPVARTYLDTELENGDYTYCLAAVYEEGESEASESVTATVYMEPHDGWYGGYYMENNAGLGISDGEEWTLGMILDFGEETFNINSIAYMFRDGTVGPVNWRLLDIEGEETWTENTIIESSLLTDTPVISTELENWTEVEVNSLTAVTGKVGLVLDLEGGGYMARDQYSDRGISYVFWAEDWKKLGEENVTAYPGDWCLKVLVAPNSIEELVPGTTELYQNYPNPFNPSTTIKFFNNMSGNVKLSVYNVKGEKVASLINGKLAAKFHTVNFDASHLNSGVYYYTLQTPTKTVTKKMIMVK